MAKSFAPIFFTAAGVVVAGIIGYVILKSELTNQKTAITVSETGASIVQQEVEAALQTPPAPVPSPSPRKIIEPEVEASADEEPKEVDTPSFDIIRVERSGDAVVAGKANANETVRLVGDEDKVVAETNSSASGEFVFVLDTPLEAGKHQLTLQVKSHDNNEEVRSSEIAIIDVPEPKSIGGVTVLLADTGKPSKILQTPEPQPEKAVSAAAKETVSVAKPAKQEAGEAKDPTLLIEAADVEAGKIFVAGRGEANKQVNLYMDNKLLGKTKVAKTDAFLFEIDKNIEPGRYDLRVDMTDTNAAEVISRAEVNLVHQPDSAIKEELQIVGAVDADKTDIDKDTKKEITTGSAVIIRRGDSLWTVARRNYGAGIRYTTIFDANRDQVRNPHRIYPGQVLQIPE